MNQLIERERINLSLTAFNGFKPKCECYTKNVVIIFVHKNHMHMFRVNLVSEDVRVQYIYIYKYKNRYILYTRYI